MLLNARLPSGQFAIPNPTTATGLSPVSDISRFREDQFNGNIDIKFSDKHSFSGKAFYASNPTTQANYNFAGLGNGISIIGSGVYDRALRTNDFGADIQDDWKITNRLTLNLGLRYDFYGYPKDIRGRLVNFVPAITRTTTSFSAPTSTRPFPALSTRPETSPTG